MTIYVWKEKRILFEFQLILTWCLKQKKKKRRWWAVQSSIKNTIFQISDDFVQFFCIINTTKLSWFFLFFKPKKKMQPSHRIFIPINNVSNVACCFSTNTQASNEQLVDLSPIKMKSHAVIWKYGKWQSWHGSSSFRKSCLLVSYLLQRTTVMTARKAQKEANKLTTDLI